MDHKRRFGTLAIFGAAAFAAALLACAPGAAADELSDLRANNQLLQQKLDQIRHEQTASPGGATDTGAAGGSFPRSFLIPGTNTSVRVGGNVTETLDYTLQGGR